MKVMKTLTNSKIKLVEFVVRYRVNHRKFREYIKGLDKKPYDSLSSDEEYYLKIRGRVRPEYELICLCHLVKNIRKNLIRQTNGIKDFHPEVEPEFTSWFPGSDFDASIAAYYDDNCSDD